MILALLATAHAGPWIQPAGAVYAELDASVQTSASLWDPSGALASQADPRFLGPSAPVFSGGRYTGAALSAYAEAGVGHGVALIGSLPVRAAWNSWTFAEGDVAPVVQSNFGLGDATLGAQWGPALSGWALAVRALGRAPLYDNSPAALHTEAGNSDFYDDRVALGPGTLEAELGLGVGASVPGIHGWAQADGAIRVRDRRYSAVVPMHAQVGVQPPGFGALWMGAEGVVSLKNGAAPDYFLDAWSKGPASVDGSQWFTVEAGAMVRWWDARADRFASQLAPVVKVDQILAGTSFPRATTATLGIAWQRPAPQSGDGT